MPGATLVSRGAPQLRREPDAPRRPRRRVRVLGRVAASGGASGYSDLYQRGVARRAGAARAGPARRRPRRRVHPQHPGSRHARARRAVAGHGLVVAARPISASSGVLDRFGQIEPKVLFCADGYRYNGEEHDSLERVAADRRQAAERAQGRGGAAPRRRSPTSRTCRRPCVLDEWLRRYTPGDIDFAQLPFDHPVYILFTSGTTGKPKCIVHGAGGTLLQGLKMFKLHFDLRPGDRFFYYCTTNWVVWNLLFARARRRGERDALRRLAVRAQRRRSCSTTPRRSASRTSAPRPSSSTRWPSAACGRATRTISRRCA